MKKRKRRNLRRGIFVLIAIVLILLLWFMYFKYNKKPRVCFDKKCFNVEIADSIYKRTEGLMFRQSLDINKGMIFIFKEQGLYNFWMKNTLISLDMIWINEDLEIVYIKENAQPCVDVCESIVPSNEALYVLEINSGLVNEFDIKEGDKARFYDFY